MIKFYKVTEEQYLKDALGNINGNDPKTIYDDIKIPMRATVGSAGYDIYSPIDFKLAPKENIKLPLGIKAEMDSNVVLLIIPRSSLGFKYKFQLDNVVGVIDSDYINSDNEGHIWVKFTNNGDKEIDVKKGTAICQGIFVNYLTTDDDSVNAIRNGGIGSTG